MNHGRGVFEILGSFMACEDLFGIYSIFLKCFYWELIKQDRKEVKVLLTRQSLIFCLENVLIFFFLILDPYFR